MGNISETLCTNVWEYFNEILGEPPHDSLKDLPLDSTCGRDCRVAIDTTAALRTVADRADLDLAEGLIETCNEICLIFWRG
jgi:hypothetical protein